MTEKVTAIGIERSFVSAWEGWDEVDVMCIMLYKVTPVDGMCPDGTVDIYVDGQKGIIGFYGSDENEISTVKVKLAIDSD